MAYSKPKLALKYARHYLQASHNGHGIHSPFVFDFVQNILNDKRRFYAYSQVEAVREMLLLDNTPIDVKDFGAGPSGTRKARTVCGIAKSAAKAPKWGQLLFRMVQYLKPQVILEFGTSLGISTAYLALANPNAQIVTMEGSPEVAALAENNFAMLSLQNIDVVRGNFDEVLPGVLSAIPWVNFAFVDGNHRLEPTVRYFKAIMNKVQDSTVIVFDDIHWSSEMERAWELIVSDNRVRCSVDLFFMGIIFFRSEFKVKQHFRIRF